MHTMNKRNTINVADGLWAEYGDSAHGFVLIDVCYSDEGRVQRWSEEGFTMETEHETIDAMRNAILAELAKV